MLARAVMIAGSRSQMPASARPGIKLKQAGIPFTIFEKNPSLGGTWYENDYPDCGVDVQSQLYSFSFEPAPPGGWSQFFAKRDELLGYFDYCADKYKIREHMEFGISVEAAAFEDGRWRVETTAADGARTTTTHNVFVSCVGQLNRPSIPPISGAETFQGDAFHTARWGGRDLTGKRVALIGTGCSAVQTLRTTAQKAEHVYVFQRTPNWIVQNPNYYKQVVSGTRLGYIVWLPCRPAIFAFTPQSSATTTALPQA